MEICEMSAPGCQPGAVSPEPAAEVSDPPLAPLPGQPAEPDPPEKEKEPLPLMPLPRPAPEKTSSHYFSGEIPE